MDNATLESKYVNNLIEARQRDEDDFVYIIRIHKLYNINIWVYTLCGEGKVDLFKPLDVFDKDRKNVRLLVWEIAGVEHCAVIKNIGTLIERPNKSQHKFYYFNKCTYWFDYQIKYGKHECSHSLKPEIVCPKRKEITFMNEHKRQNKKNIITADIECCVVHVTTNSNIYVIIAEHIPISVGYICQSNFKYYFGLDCIKRFASDLLKLETENKFKRNKQMIFTKKNKLCHNATNSCHISGKTCIKIVRDHCHETVNIEEHYIKYVI